MATEQTIYTAGDVERIQSSYRAIFPELSPSLHAFLYPQTDESWACMTTRFLDPSPTPSKFTEFDDALKDVDLNYDAKTIGANLAALAWRHGVGFSLGLNPWADYLLYKTFDAEKTRSIVVVVAHNWNPLVKVFERAGQPPEIPDSPLTPDDPCVYLDYAAAIDPFFATSPETAVLFLNLFPHFKAAGEEPNGPLNQDQLKAVGGRRGMQEALLDIVEAVNPSYRVAGIVSWGAPVWETLSGKVAGVEPGNLLPTVETVRKAATIQDLPSLGDRKIPYVPYVHPSSYEWRSHKGWEVRQEDYRRLVRLLCRMSP